MKRLGDLEIGDRIQTGSGNADYSDVYFFGHRIATPLTHFLRIACSSNETILVSPDHYVYANEELKTASSVRVGDIIYSAAHGASDVTGIEVVTARGLYAPHTLDNSLVVDGIIVSPFTRAVHPNWAKLLLKPARWVYIYTGFSPFTRFFAVNSHVRIASSLSLTGPLTIPHSI